ncbi:MAG TPA: DegT/DnrJ/EryC1/StrS family aminotransferase [Beijerinckiaceae bacterium]|nr:DegT/DnrJ/EryC1/StrS family aminotransferase [Methylobacteriaceae bacterium]MCC0002289.1 DegT/DnrJ/EryC1/StrS family aminotransferase [Methylobacteriaceae bacterium]HRY03321.1 DegT/DnrJ/EryC1/StrS family aminotransferase [Beijerinckiaceae bacterium]
MIVSPERIPVAGPSITDREPELAAEAARTAWYGNHYAYNARFEQMLTDYVGVAHAVSLPHCTSGLHLALAALGVGPGDEVIVPNVTWIASVAPIVYVGAEPVLVDIRADTWCIDPDAVEAAIGPKTKAIIGVDLYGSMCDWDQLQAVADRHGLHLIEDSAEALGSSLNGRKAGAFGRVSAFSFHGSKTVATGEGGMLATNDTGLFDRVLFLRDHGRAPGDRFFQNSEIAFKYRMSAVQAALGVAQMERIDELIAHKRAIFRWYQQRLSGLQGVALNAEPNGVVNSYWMVTIVPDASFGLDKFQIMEGLNKRNIDSRPFFSRLSDLQAFDDRPVSKRFVRPDERGAAIARGGVNLPSGYNMDEAKVDIVAAAVKEIFGARA